MPSSIIFWLALLQSSILIFSGIGEASSAGACDGSHETCTAVPGILPFSQERLSTVLEKVPCNVKRIDAHDMDAKTFEETYRRGSKSLIVRNWTGQWPAHSSWQDGGFIKRVGDLELTVKYQIVPDADVSLGRMTVEKYLTSPQEHLMFDTGDWSLVGSRARDDMLPLPEALETASLNPVYTIGRNGTGSAIHAHDEAWISQVVGIKVWILAPGFVESGAALKESTLGANGKIHQVNPCELLDRLADDRASFHEELQVCAVGPGETVYVPEHMHHATCNFGDVTIGVGARGNSTRSQLMRYVMRCDLENFIAHVEKYGDLGLHSPVDNPLGQQWPYDTLRFAGHVNCVSIVEYLIGAKKGLKQGVEQVDAHAKANTSRYKIPADRALHVSNLDEKINVETMRAFLHWLFDEFDEVDRVFVLNSPQRRGQAWVIYKDSSSIKGALTFLNNVPFFNKPLKLSAVRSKKMAKREDFPL